ncbi:MAG TPA: glycosyltransferase [Pelobium sp.]|nr:glycosyltransferase [Pelobium sp.]
MKTLHITASYKPAFIYGGPIYSVATLCEELCKVESQQSMDNGQWTMDDKRKSKVFVTVYTTLANGDIELPYSSGKTETVDSVSVTYFKRITKDHSHFSPALLMHLWKNVKKFDVIHIHSWWNLVSMGAVIVCLCRGVKPIVSPRGMLGDYTMSKGKSLFHRLVGKQLLKRCNFHATTAMEAKEIAQRVFDGKVEVVDLMEEKSKKGEVKSKKNKEQGTKRKEQRVENSLKGTPSPSERAGVRLFIIHNLVKLPEKLPLRARVFDGTLNLIFLSRIHHKKGIELLLDALALVDFPFRLSIVGEGEPDYAENLKRKAVSEKLDGYINWVGAVYGDEKYQLLADHDAFILPSYNENFANVVIEAIAVGTPVLLSEHVGLQDYVKANQYGLVFKLDELKSSLDNAYRLFSGGRLSIDRMGLIDNGSLTDKYLEMYNECFL